MLSVLAQVGVLLDEVGDLHLEEAGDLLGLSFFENDVTRPFAAGSATLADVVDVLFGSGSHVLSGAS